MSKVGAREATTTPLFKLETESYEHYGDHSVRHNVGQRQMLLSFWSRDFCTIYLSIDLDVLLGPCLS